MGRDLCKQEEGQCCGPTKHHCLPGTLYKRQGVMWVVSELGKEDRIKGMNTARKISTALLSLCLLGSELQGSGKESTGCQQGWMRELRVEELSW